MRRPLPPLSSDLLNKPHLSIPEMTELLADAVAKLPSVRFVSVLDGTDIAVGLQSGQHIEVQTLPLAARMNASSAERHTLIDEVLRRCA